MLEAACAGVYVMAKAKVPKPLFDAVNRGSLAELQQALRDGVDIEAVDRAGRTALFYTIADKHPDLCSALLSATANVNHRDKHGRTPLHFAAMGYDVDLAPVLISAGAIIDATDVYGNTPLCEAVFVSRGRGDMIRILLAAGADKNKTNNYGVSPLSLAKKIANYEVAQFLE